MYFILVMADGMGFGSFLLLSQKSQFNEHKYYLKGNEGINASFLSGNNPINS